MARQIHLRDDRHLPFRRIAYQLHELLLRVVTPWLALVGNLSTHLGQLRIGLDLDAPTLIVREVHVQHIHLIKRQKVDHLLHLLWREETARDIQRETPPSEPRRIFHLQDRQIELTVLRRCRILCHDLRQCGDTPIKPLYGRSLDVDILPFDRE